MPAYITSLICHFEDLRDGTHGGSTSRKDKEAHFEKAVQLLAPIARQVFEREQSVKHVDSRVRNSDKPADEMEVRTDQEE